MRNLNSAMFDCWGWQPRTPVPLAPVAGKLQHWMVVELDGVCFRNPFLVTCLAASIAGEMAACVTGAKAYVQGRALGSEIEEVESGEQ